MIMPNEIDLVDAPAWPCIARHDHSVLCTGSAVLMSKRREGFRARGETSWASLSSKQPDGQSTVENANTPGSAGTIGWELHHMDLCGKVAVITGGKRIGRVVARELAERGMNLVLSYRGSKDEAEQTVEDVESIGRRATIVAGDVSRPADCARIVDQALTTFGRLDVLV